MIFPVCSAWVPDPTAKVNIRLRHAEVVEEGLAHLLIVVLTGMDQQMLDLIRIFIHGLDNRGHFHKIGTGAHNVDNFHSDIPHYLTAKYPKKKSPV